MPSSSPIIESVGELSDEALAAIAKLLVSNWRRERAAAAAAEQEAEGQEVAHG